MKINANLNVANSTNLQKTNSVTQRKCTDRSNFPSTLSQDSRIFASSAYSNPLKTCFDKIFQFLKRCLSFFGFFKAKEVTPVSPPAEPQNQQPAAIPTQGTITPVLPSQRSENIPSISPQAPVQPNPQNTTNTISLIPLPIPTLTLTPSPVILPTASPIVTSSTTPTVPTVIPSSEASTPTTSSLAPLMESTPEPSSVSPTVIPFVTPTITLTPTSPVSISIPTPTSAPITSPIPIEAPTTTTSVVTPTVTAVQSTNSVTTAISPVALTSATRTEKSQTMISSDELLPGFDTLSRSLAARSQSNTFGSEEKKPRRGDDTLRRVWQEKFQGKVSSLETASNDNNLTTSAPQSVSPPIQSLESILLFYSGKGRNSDGLSLNDIRAKTDQILNEDNDLIAMLFPIDQPDTLYPKVPVLDQSMINAMKQNDAIGKELRTSFTTILLFYGLFWGSRSSDHPRKIVPASSFKERAAVWLTSYNHNFHRITRVLRSLTLFGYQDDSRSFLEGLLEVAKHYPAIDENIKSAWRKAATPSTS